MVEQVQNRLGHSLNLHSLTLDADTAILLSHLGYVLHSGAM